MFYVNQLVVFVGLLDSYFVYNYEFCYKLLIIQGQYLREALVLMALNNLMFILMIWFYLLIVFKKHKSVKPEYIITKRLIKKLKLVNLFRFGKFKLYDTRLETWQNESIERYTQKLNHNILTRNSHGQISICFKCNIIRPDRCFHCSKCSNCILKRDHHCPLLNKCIGYSNHKYFILFLAYTLIYTMFTTLTMTWYIWTSLNSFKVLLQTNTIFSSFNLIMTLSSMVLIVIPVALLLINTLYMVSRNLTNIEQNYPPRIKLEGFGLKNESLTDNIFDLGNMSSNFEQIFGSSLLLGVLPVWTTEGNGHEFPIGCVI